MSTAADTRQRLIDYGRVAFATRGHDGVSLQRDVLEASKVSTGSFYHQFNDKTELLVAILEDASDRIQDLFAQRADEVATDVAPIARVQHRLEVWLDLVSLNEELFRIQMRERSSPDERVRRLLAELRVRTSAPLVAEVEEAVGQHVPEFDSDRVARMISGMTMSTALDYLELPKTRRKKERDAVISTLAAFIIGGVAATAGLLPLAEVSP